jgi:hypothetical protein
MFTEFSIIEPELLVSEQFAGKSRKWAMKYHHVVMN